MRAVAALLAVGLLSSVTFVPAAHAEEPDWSAVVERVSRAVIQVRMDRSRTFASQTAGNSTATGFVVDAERGILLTNRHVVGPGPGRAEAILLDNEELDLQPIYRDPVHDFGFYRYDPADVRFMELEELELDPSGAVVGAEVRIIGNDAGEKISILDGTLARVDRGAPSYGQGRYNDFNTFYIQAASGTSGGSSGSPVVDGAGRVVALNAGSRNRAASSYFLPLPRVMRALELIQAGKPVTRGTLQTTFRHTSHDELRRLGLTEGEEAGTRERFPEGTGLLVVERVLPLGPAHDKLRPGDIVLSVNGEWIDDFIDLEAVLDDSVGGSVELRVVRGGGALNLTLPVGDLHAITPDSYLEAGGAVLHPLSYQRARTYNVPVVGVTLATAGYVFSNAGMGRGAVILEIDGRATLDLDAVQAALEQLPDGARVPVRWFDVREPSRERVSIIDWDRRWTPLQRCALDPATGDWPCEDAAPAPAASPWPAASAPVPPSRSRVGKKAAPSLVTVDFTTPFRVEGVHGDRFRGTGIVLDAERGWVLTDRDTVPVALGDVSLVFGGTVEVPGRVVWLHPAHNMAVVEYDPALIGDTKVEGVRLSPRPLEPGTRTWHVGLDSTHQVVERKTRISRRNPINLPVPRTPFFRQVNLDGVDPEAAASSTGGLLVDRRGRMMALWASFVDLSGKDPDAWFHGLPAAVVEDALDMLDEQGPGPWPTLGAELRLVELKDARHLGLTAARAEALAAKDPERRSALVINRLTADSDAAAVLRVGDLVLECGGALVTRFADVEDAVVAGRGAPVALTVLRDGQETTVEVTPQLVPGVGVERALSWAGALLHEVPRWLPEQRGVHPIGVYVTWYWYGSPAARYGLRASSRVIEVDGQPVDSLDAFQAAVEGAEGPVRLVTLDLKNREKAITLKLDPQAWPAFVLERDGETGDWSRQAWP